MANEKTWRSSKSANHPSHAWVSHYAYLAVTAAIHKTKDRHNFRKLAMAKEKNIH